MKVSKVKCALLLALSCVLGQPAFCADLPAGQVVWWGKNYFWTKTISDKTNGLVENGDEPLGNVVAVTGTTGIGLALKNDGTVFAFGLSSWPGVTDLPVGLSNVVSITEQGGSFWAIKRDGKVANWGSWGSYDQYKKNIIAGLSNITAIASGGFEYYLALKNDSTVSAFQLGDDTPPGNSATEPAVHPLAIQGQVLSNVVAMASMGFTPLVLKNDGSVFSLGYRTPGDTNESHPLFEFSVENSNTLVSHVRGGIMQLYTSLDPVMVDGQVLSNVVALSSDGRESALALKRNGTVVAPGNSDAVHKALPAGLSNVIAIAGGGNYGMALKRDGKVVAWGDNQSGQTSVPAGLSNVVAIAAAGDFSLAVTTGSVPASVYIIPHGQLEILAREADLIFKGQVVSDQAGTNAAFPSWAKPHATEFKIISVIKGKLDADTLVFWHYTGGPMAWSGGRPPPEHHFEVGQSYLVFAAKLDKPDYLYTVPAAAASRPNEFRQLYGGGVMQTLDARTHSGSGFKEAHWFELNLLLNDANPTNQLYAIDMLDQMSLAGRGDDEWRHSDDFNRKTVLSALLPLATNSNEQVATRAISCFAAGAKPAAMTEPFAKTLVPVANDGPTSSRRLNAIGSLSGTHFEAVSNSLAQLLQNPDENVRSSAVGLLALFPGAFSEQALRERAIDDSPKVRAVVADVIGNGKDESLLPTLVKLFADPVGLRQPLPPLTVEELEAESHDISSGDVHSSAGLALLKFDLNQVGNFLKTNLNDPSFRLQFLCKLAEKDPKPWINDMVEMMETRRARNEKTAETEISGVQQRLHYLDGLMSLSGSHYTCWNIIYNFLHDLPAADFVGSKLDRCLDALGNAVNTGSQDPTTLYELYRLKDLEKCAAEFRSKCEKTFSYDISTYFNRVDAQFTNSPPIK